MNRERISIHMQGKWIQYHEDDLFVIFYGENDEDVQVYTSCYYESKFGTKELPVNLKRELEKIGVHYDDNVGEYYFSRIDGIPISDEMKAKIKRVVLNFTYTKK
jgi:hypothetical protein